MAQEIYHRSEWGNPNEQWGNIYLNADLTNELYKRASEYENSWVTDQLLNGVGTKPSIILTPTAYEDGVLNSVKPNKTLGSELVTNGTFDTDSNWSFDNVGGTKGWRIADNRAICDVSGVSNGRNLQQYLDIPITSGKKYKISLDILQSDDNILLFIGGQTLTLPTGTNLGYETTFVASSTSTLITFFASTSDTQEIDNVSIKEQTDADFDFTRNSSATRVNEQGLVEDVQILSNNLVQNGDFSQEGAELVTNGDFSNGSTDWSNPDNAATFSNDSVTISGGSGNRRIVQANVTSPTSAQWKLQYEITEKVGSSDLKLYTTNSGIAAYTVVPSAVGVHTFYFNSNLTNFYFNFSDSTGSITIDNVSIKEVGQDWTFGTGWSIGDNVANAVDAAFNSQLVYSDNVVANTKYKVSFNVSNYVKGNVRVNIGNVGSDTVSSNGNFTFVLTSANVAPLIIQSWAGGSGTTLSITNISVIEITEDTNLPRIDYTGGTGHWLFEPQSTNEISYSEDFSNVYWSKLGSPTITSNYGTSPDGQNNSVRIQGNSSTIIYNNGGFSATDGRSMYVKATSGSGSIQLLSNFNNTDNVFSIDENWKRVEINTSSSVTFNFYAVDMRGASTDIFDIEIWGAQIEQLSYATSYIPTNGSTVTRLQDAAFGAGSSDLINSTEGVLYAEIAALADGVGTRTISVSDGTNNNSITIRYTTNSGRVNAFIVAGGIIQFSADISGVSVLDFNKVAIKYSLNDMALWINGVEVATDINGTMPLGLNEINFTRGDGANKFFGKTKCLAVFKEALTDAELTCLTTI